jgi:hypothetical protein
MGIGSSSRERSVSQGSCEPQQAPSRWLGRSRMQVDGQQEE